jgi:hypothetical protein
MNCIRRSNGRGVIAPVDDLEVVLPIPGGAGELPLTLDVVLPERSGEALVEPGVVAPDPQDAVLESDSVRPAHAARVEILHDEPLAAFGGADDADCVWEQVVVVAGALDDEVAALKPLERRAARYGAIEHRVGRLGVPGADERVERLEGRISLGLSHTERSPMETLAARA